MKQTKDRLLTLALLLLALAVVACAPSRRGGGDDDDSASSDDDDGDDDDDDGDDDDSDGNSEDSDGDGLTDLFENTIGTDPQNPDTDGDGFDDETEHLNYFFADDSSDWPYVGDYPREPIPESVASGGQGAGSVPSNFSDEDQFGQELFFHRFYGNVVLVELAAEW
jgi:cobalamin biosynthesis protein CobT